MLQEGRVRGVGGGRGVRGVRGFGVGRGGVGLRASRVEAPPHHTLSGRLLGQLAWRTPRSLARLACDSGCCLELPGKTEAVAEPPARQRSESDLPVPAAQEILLGPVHS